MHIDRNRPSLTYLCYKYWMADVMCHLTTETAKVLTDYSPSIGQLPQFLVCSSARSKSTQHKYSITVILKQNVIQIKNMILLIFI